MYGCWRCLEESCKWPWWSWLVLFAVMIVVAYLLQPKPRGDEEKKKKASRQA